MKVLFINSAIYGSTGRICLDLQTGLFEHGYDSIICFGRGGTNGNNFCFQTSSGVMLDGLKTRFFDNCGLNSKKQTSRLINFIISYKPDIIHIHNLHGYYLNVDMLFSYFKNQYGGSIIWTLHDCWPFTGHCSHFDFVKCEKWKTHCFKCEQKNMYPKSICCDKSYKNYDLKRQIFNNVKNLRIVAPSNWLANLVKESFLQEYPISVIKNGIDLDCFSKNSSILKDSILFVAAQWTKRKGGHLISDIVSEFSSFKKIIIVGKWKIKKPKISNCVFIEKRLSKTEMNSLYNSACCLVNPTLEDNFPTVNIEAQCCGLPVVTFNSGGSSETIFLKKSVIVSKGNVKEMKNGILKILDSQALDGVNQKKIIFSRDRMVDDYLQLYQEVLTNEN